MWKNSDPIKRKKTRHFHSEKSPRFSLINMVVRFQKRLYTIFWKTAFHRILNKLPLNLVLRNFDISNRLKISVQNSNKIKDHLKITNFIRMIYNCNSDPPKRKKTRHFLSEKSPQSLLINMTVICHNRQLIEFWKNHLEKSLDRNFNRNFYQNSFNCTFLCIKMWN